MTSKETLFLENSPQLLYVTEAASVLRVSRAYAYRLVARGELPSVRIGKSVRVPYRALLDYLARNEIRAHDDDAHNR